MLQAFGDGVGVTGRAHEVPGTRQRPVHDDRSRQVDQPDGEEGLAPGKVVGDNARDITSQKSAQYRARDISRHRLPDQVAGKFFVDVRHDDDDDAGNEHALHESPEDQLVQGMRGGGQQGGHGQGIQRRDDHLLAADGLSQQTDNGRSQGHRQNRCADGQADRDGGGVKELL